MRELRVPDDEFAAWVHPHLESMARLAARLGGGADRDDLVQEALTRAWRRRETFDPGRGTPRTWLLAIVADQARKARRRRRPEVATNGTDAAVAPVDGDRARPGARARAAPDAHATRDRLRVLRRAHRRRDRRGDGRHRGHGEVDAGEGTRAPAVALGGVT